MSHPKKFFLETLGCQMNIYDSELLIGEMLRSGFEMTDDRFSADIILYNTCSVRDKAEEKIYSRLGELKSYVKHRPNLIVGVLGCMAQRDAKRILKRSKMVNLVVGTKRFLDVPDLISEVTDTGGPVVATEDNADILVNRDVTRRANPYQAYLAIMRGCNNFCSYCVVPYTRGREESRNADDIIEESKKLIDDGVIEITLLGQNVNSYKGCKGGFPELLNKLSEIKGLERLWFVTNHPKDFSKEVAMAIAENDIICEYLHLPAQSGSNEILKKMNRGYTAEHYLELLDMAREIVPKIEIASDFIVGFPGETEEQFEDTYKLVEKAQYQNSFIFKYSPRPGAKAFDMEDDVPRKIKEERNHRLLQLQLKISEEKNKELIGQTTSVLFEGPSKSDPLKLTGRTRTNRIAILPLNDKTKNYVGQIKDVEIESATALSIYCKSIT